MHPYLKRLQPLAAWLLAFVILYFLFRQVPPKAVWQSVLRADLTVFIALAILYFIVVYFLDSWSMVHILRFHDIHIPLRKFLHFRGHSYYYSLLNYNAGQGLLAYYIKQSESTSWFKVGSIVFYVMLNDFFLLLATAAIAFALAPPRSMVMLSIHHLLYGVIAVLLALFVICKFTPYLVKPLREKMQPGSWYAFMAHYRARHLALTFCYRMLVLGGVILGLYLPFIPFHIDISFVRYLASAPLVLIVGALPITPAGLGTMQSAFVMLFSPHVSSPLLAAGASPEPLLLALVLSWAFANLVLKLIAGLYFHSKIRNALSLQKPN